MRLHIGRVYAVSPIESPNPPGNSLSDVAVLGGRGVAAFERAGGSTPRPDSTLSRSYRPEPSRDISEHWLTPPTGRDTVLNERVKR